MGGHHEKLKILIHTTPSQSPSYIDGAQGAHI